MWLGAARELQSSSGSYGGNVLRIIVPVGLSTHEWLAVAGSSSPPALVRFRSSVLRPLATCNNLLAGMVEGTRTTSRTATRARVWHRKCVSPTCAQDLLLLAESRVGLYDVLKSDAAARAGAPLSQKACPAAQPLHTSR